MAIDPSRIPVEQKVQLPGHLDQAVTLEGIRPLGKGFECRVKGRKKGRPIRLTTKE